MLGAVAQVRRDLVLPEWPRAAEHDLGAFALAPVVGSDALPGIGGDLRLGQPTGEPRALFVRRELGIQPGGSQRGIEPPGDVFLPVAAVRPVAVGVLVGRSDAAAEGLAGAVVPGARLVRAVAAEAAEHLPAALTGRGAAGDDVDRAARGAAAVLDGAAAAHDLDALDRVDRD